MSTICPANGGDTSARCPAARWRGCLPPAMVGAWQGTLTTRRRRCVARALHALGEQRREQSAREFAGQSGTPRESAGTPQEGAGRRGNPRDDPPLATNQKVIHAQAAPRPTCRYRSEADVAWAPAVSDRAMTGAVRLLPGRWRGGSTFTRSAGGGMPAGRSGWRRDLREAADSLREKTGGRGGLREGARPIRKQLAAVHRPRPREPTGRRWPRRCRGRGWLSRMYLRTIRSLRCPVWAMMLRSLAPAIAVAWRARRDPLWRRTAVPATRFLRRPTAR